MAKVKASSKAKNNYSYVSVTVEACRHKGKANHSYKAKSTGKPKNSK